MSENTFRDNCALQMDEACSENKLRAVKLVRATMEEIAHFVHKNKECIDQIKVIHLLRDPRGRLNSLHKCCNFNYTNPKQILRMCERQMKDVDIAKRLTELYPNTIMEIQYEQLASDTMTVSQNMYKFLFDSNISTDVVKWITSNNSNKPEQTYNTNRKDSKLTSLAWKKEISPEAEKIIKEKCKKLINHLAYAVQEH